MTALAEANAVAIVPGSLPCRGPGCGERGAPCCRRARVHVEQAQHPHDHLRVDGDRLPLAVAVSGRHAVCGGQLGQ